MIPEVGIEVKGVEFEMMKLNGILLSEVVFRRERKIPRRSGIGAREMPPPAGKNASVRHDAVVGCRTTVHKHRSDQEASVQRPL